MSDESKLLELARQGDTNAIETILNKELEGKNIDTKVILKDNCLQIMLVSPQVPERQFIAAFVCKKITSLCINSVERLKIHGKQIEDEFYAWSQEFELLKTHNLIPSIIKKVSTSKSDNTNYLHSNLLKHQKIPGYFSILNQYQLTGIAGTISLFVGLFIPVESIGSGSKLSRQSFFSTEIVMPYDELIIILLAIVSLVLVLENNKQKWLIGSGLLAFCFTLVGFIKSFQDNLYFDASDVRLNNLYSQLLVGSSTDRTEFNFNLVSIGWIFLFVGSELIVLSALSNLIKDRLINKNQGMKMIGLCTASTLISIFIIMILCV